MQALALKYRPKNFNELIGQDIIASSLSRALDSDRLGHAYLFSGLRGSGKTSSARIFAKALLCERGISAHPCEVCEHCKMANEGRHLDIIEMDAASHRSIDDIRDLTEQTRYAPISGRFKIFIIDEAHMLTQQACNALLKTLEEPPAYIKFILATTDPLKLPATILSRTQHFRFKPISMQNITHHLEFILSKESIKYEEEALNILARAGEGSLRDTLTLLDQAIIFTHENISATQVADMLGILDPARIDEILHIVETGNEADISTLIKELNESDATMIINELIANLKFKFISASPSFSLLIFERFFRILSEAKNMLGNGADAEFVLYITLFMMKECFNIHSIDSMIDARSEQNVKSLQTTSALKPSYKTAPQNEAASMQTPRDAASSLATPQPNTEPRVTSANAMQNGASQDSIKPSSSDKYEQFLKLLDDRSYDLGECFRACITYDGFENGAIKLISSANDEQSAMLRKYSPLMKELGRVSFASDKFAITKQAPKPSNMPKNDEDLLNNILGSANEAQKIQEAQGRKEKPLNDIKPINAPLNDAVQAQTSVDENQTNYEMSSELKTQETKEVQEVQNTQNDEALSKDDLRNIKEMSSLFGEPEIIQL